MLLGDKLRWGEGFCLCLCLCLWDFAFSLFIYLFFMVSLFICVINDHRADDFIIVSLIVLGGCTKK